MQDLVGKLKQTTSRRKLTPSRKSYSLKQFMTIKIGTWEPQQMELAKIRNRENFIQIGTRCSFASLFGEKRDMNSNVAGAVYKRSNYFYFALCLGQLCAQGYSRFSGHGLQGSAIGRSMASYLFRFLFMSPFSGIEQVQQFPFSIQESQQLVRKSYS